jgi:hypothetical protein
VLASLEVEAKWTGSSSIAIDVDAVPPGSLSVAQALDDALAGLTREASPDAGAKGRDSRRTRQLTEDLLDRLDSACEAQTLVITIDDVHRADQSSLAVLAQIAAGTASARLLLVMSCPDEALTEPPQVLTELLRQSQTLQLEPLSKNETHQLLRSLFGESHELSDAAIQWEPPLQSRLLKKLSEKTGKKYRSFQDIFCAKEIGKKVSKKLGSLDCDVFITNDYSIAAYVQSPAPIILYTDSIFPRYYSRNQHPWLDNLFFINVWSCQYVNAQGLKKADLVVFPTTWAKDEALLYGLKEEKIRIIPFGANLEGVKTLTLPSRSFKKILGKGYIDLLFVGTRHPRGRGGQADRQRLHRAYRQGAPVGVRGGDESPHRAPDGGLHWLSWLPSATRSG